MNIVSIYKFFFLSISINFLKQNIVWVLFSYANILMWKKRRRRRKFSQEKLK